MTVKLIALDLDGTTLGRDGRLSEGNRDAILKAIEKGVMVVVATGRCFCSLPPDITELSSLQYVITSNGAQIRSLDSGKAFYNNCIAPEAVEEAAGILCQKKEVYEADRKRVEAGEKSVFCHDLSPDDYMVEVFVDGDAYIERSLYESIRDGGNSYRHREYVIGTREPVDDVVGFMLEHKNEIENINIFFYTQEKKAEMKPVLDSIRNATVTSSLDNNWEIGGATTSKANALKVLCERLGIEKSEIMAVGDSPNDIPMLDLADIAVAVGNAKVPVKEAACFVSEANYDDGVAVAIRKFVLMEE